MRSTNVRNAILKTAALVGLTLASGATYAQTYYLQAQEFTKTLTLPDSSTVEVTMWGFASCNDDYSVCDPATVPGPQITATEGSPLTIDVNNNLPVPVSIFVPGQVGTGSGGPVMDGNRVQSFVTEVGAGGTGSYTFSSPRAGTYLYQSGTHPSIQVPMGLYGALVVDSSAAVTCTGMEPSWAYDDADSCYDNDVVMLFSEIDPDQNASVAAAGGTVSSYPSTIDYSPSFLLVNGELSATLQGIGDDDPMDQDSGRVLLRLLNAGSHTHTPAIVGLEMQHIAEDGNVYPGLPRAEAQALLPAGQTKDVIVNLPADDVTFSLYDRTPDFTNAGLPGGGLVANIDANEGSDTTPVASPAMDDEYDVDEDTPLNVVIADGVLDNDASLSNASVVSTTSHGTLSLSADGSFTYAPDPDFSGVDGFTYTATDGANGYGASVTLNVSFVNDAPVAVADGPYSNAVGTDIVVSAAQGLLGNDVDVDGDDLTVEIQGTAPTGLTIDLDDGSFTYSGEPTSFSYRASDGTDTSDLVAVQLVPAAPSNVGLTVFNTDGEPITAYRWIVQEDRTYKNEPGSRAPIPMQQSLNFHKSTMPVVAQGCVGCEENDTPLTDAVLDTGKYYYVSVLPNDATLLTDDTDLLGEGVGIGHTIGGAQILPGQDSVTVVVNKQEIPTAQISVFVFEDDAPTNGAPDAGEPGLGGFQISLEDAAGRYGQNGGMMAQDAFGNPLTNSLPCAPPATPGVIVTCADGTALIENLPPGKYGVFAQPPASTPDTWAQSSTIEGSKIIDAWVKAGEPAFMLEFGGPGPHAFIGFVNPAHTCFTDAGPECQVDPGTPAPGGSSTISGNVTLLHDPRPPGTPGTVDAGSYAHFAHTRAWVGLNTIAGDGPNIATVQAGPDGDFEITGIPDGTYQLVIWDAYLQQVISFQTVTLPGGGAVGNIPVPAWFTRAEHNVFLDSNENGVWDEDELPLAEQAVNLRWRDGTVNLSFPTDLEGFVPFDSIFPFFHWQTFEVDYTRFKPTGVTVTVDAGGAITSPDYPGLLEPQEQAGGESSRTETGPVLTQAYQGFPGQTSIFEWGKIPYGPGENGGISGIVFYGSTRGEGDPRLTVGDTWEPGIAEVTVRLYKEIARNPEEVDTDVVPDDPFPDLDAGDVDINGNDLYDGPTTLKLVTETTTDSWDASLPTECPGETPGDPYTTETLLNENIDRCYDGWRNWNQVRPGLFDGGYAFGTEGELEPGAYVVEVVVPDGYELIKEQDINVGFGDAFGSVANTYMPTPVVLPNGMLVSAVPDPAMIAAAMGPEPGIAQPPCVGEYHQVPLQLSLFPGPAPFAEDYRPLCDRKRVVLSDQGQAAADFHLFTTTPVATQFTGLITDDLSNEIDPTAPGFGEKWSPAYLPFAIRDYNGREVYRGYSDAYGHYNGMAYSTFTANMPIPSGYSPAMLATCLNDLGDNPDLEEQRLQNYSNSCYTLQFMPGTTTYLDTPVLPTAAFAAGFYPADCAAPERTPTIATVTGEGNIGPLVATEGTLTIASHGTVAVPNPAYGGPQDDTNPETIMRDLGFGGMAGTALLDGEALSINTWTDTEIVASLPAGIAEGSYQLVVTRDTGETSINTVTVTVGNETPIEVTDGQSIQDAIDTAQAGSLILVGPGEYKEQVVLYKPLRLQGAGADTIINALKNPTENLQDWIDLVSGLFDGTVDLLPGQVDPTLAAEQGAGVTVLASNDDSFSNTASRIDGFTITNADVGGGIFVNGWAHGLQISNNNITANSGSRHGGIRLGHPGLPLEGGGPFGFNNDVAIHHNSITSNGALSVQASGGGVSLSAGTDNYAVTENFICGNYAAGDGAGIGHLGMSDNGLIQFNTIVFNQSFSLSFNQHGGGIAVSGEAAEPPGLTIGAGDVTIDGNRIQGNQAASGNGGGIRAQLFNGVDVQTGNSSRWHKLTITNNMLVNNVAGGAGAGISLQDAVNASVVLNTIANNDSTATTGAVLGVGGVSEPQPSGLSSELNSIALNAALPGGSPNKDFSNPTLTHNILWHNRSFYFDGTELQPVLDPTEVGECVPGATYIDLGVIDAGPGLNPRNNILTDTTGYHGSNFTVADPEFVSDYCNHGRRLTAPGPDPILATAAFAEGGNSVDVRYGPLTLEYPAAATPAPWDYHLQDISPAIDRGNNTGGNSPSVGGGNDIDSEARPFDVPGVGGNNTDYDLGADEVGAGSTEPPPPPPPPAEDSMVAFASATGDATLDAAAGTLAFGSQSGDVSSEVTIAVNGDTSVTFGTLVMDSGNGARFELGNDSCTGATIGPNFVCTVTIDFASNGNQVRLGSLTIPHNATATPSPLVLQLSGQ